MAKELFPGKRNSLDALCDRLEVDNSDAPARRLAGCGAAGRRLHQHDPRPGCAADHGRRGPFGFPGESELGSQQRVDLSRIALQVLRANEQELASHEAVLAELDKSSDGKTIWRTAEQAAA
jgi:DNA polymerase-3 subunit epsilon